MLRERVTYIIQKLYNDSTLLTRKCPDMITKLQSQGNPDSDGTGNKVTNQEAAFAQLLVDNGFHWIPKSKKKDWKDTLTNQGLSFIYQVNGTQASLDFMLMNVENNTIVDSLLFDLKYSAKGQKIMLNDGWFEPNVLYLFTWIHATKVRTFVGLSDDFTTKEERDKRAHIRTLLAELNSGQKNVGNLSIYIRCANQYNLKGFTEEFSNRCKEKVVTWLTSSQPQSVSPSTSQVSFVPVRLKKGVLRKTSESSQLPSQEEEEPHFQPEQPVP